MFRKLLSFLFIVLIVLGIGIEKVEAEPAEPAKPYTYSVEFDGGRYGEVYDESENAVSVISDIPYGSTFYRNGNNVTIVKPDHSELKYHLKQIFLKMGVSNRTELLTKAYAGKKDYVPVR